MESGLRLQFATTNPHKLAELRAALPGWSLEPLELTRAVEEDGPTFAANARLKAAAARTEADAGAWVVAEDSGLEVDGLGGRPGVLSARYARPGEDAVSRLLGELGDADGEARRARYVCELLALSPSGEEYAGRGTLQGTIALEPRGAEGFGYDPVFVPDGESRSVAELGDAWKSANSHRARAALALRAVLAGSTRR